MAGTWRPTPPRSGSPRSPIGLRAGTRAIPAFAFGTGKFGDLAAFSSAIILALIAVQIAYESVVRLVHPVPIAYGEAIAVAVLGLAVNLVSAWLLRDSHDHHHHGHGRTALP